MAVYVVDGMKAATGAAGDAKSSIASVATDGHDLGRLLIIFSRQGLGREIEINLEEELLVYLMLMRGQDDWKLSNAVSNEKIVVKY